MFPVVLLCVVLAATTTVVHYELLRTLNSSLASMSIPARSKLLVVILIAFLAHAFEVFIYGLGFFLMARYGHWGAIRGAVPLLMSSCVYVSLEAFTTLGFVDLVPSGALRILAGAEALNGLLLIGWSASYAYIAMERFWKGELL